jgi:hypothetical protein
LSPEEQQQAAAIDAVTAYVRVLNELGADPTGDLNQVNYVAFDPARTFEIDRLRQWRRDGTRIDGAAELEGLSARPVEGGIEVLGCTDMSQVSVLGPNGEVLLAAADRDPPRLSSRWLVVYDDDSDGWYVSEDDVVFADETRTVVQPC